MELLTILDIQFSPIMKTIEKQNDMQTERLVEQYQIEKYHLNSVFAGSNIDFFEEKVFLTMEDIVSTSISIKDVFFKQLMNIYDFVKINIMLNGDVYSNVNHLLIGNICVDRIHGIIQKK